MNKTRTRAGATQSKRKGRIKKKDEMTGDGTRTLEHDKQDTQNRKRRRILNNEQSTDMKLKKVSIHRANREHTHTTH